MAATKAVNTSVAIAMAFAGRSARACDVCANKSSHWFCAADDAYLCTACDTNVHSANALSRRHERVRLSPNGMPMKTSSSKEIFKVPKSESHDHHGCHTRSPKKLHPSPPQVAPVRKRSRTARPYSHHLKKLTQMVKSEPTETHPSSLELDFDLFDADEFLVTDAGNQEVPNLSTVISHDSSPSSSDFDLLSSDYEFQEVDHSASADSFAVFFKGKAAHSQSAKASKDGDQFLVPDTFEEFCIDGETPSDASVVPADDAFFFPGDIPGLEAGFESFVPEMDLSSDDFSLTFDLALQNANNGVETFEGEGPRIPKTDGTQAPHDAFTAGPFAKWFATRTKSDLDEPMCPERIKRDVKEMLKCCQADDDTHKVPSLQLNIQEVLTAWSDRGELWIDFKPPQTLLSQGSGSGSISGSISDVGLVPDMDANSLPSDETQSGGDRDARVLRYKEKRRTRLFSKKIRYEVRKLNAERRPRMKGRFVKRTAVSS